MSADARTLPDSSPLHRLLARARLLLRSGWVATGAGVTLGLLFGALVVLAAIDLFVPFEPLTLPWLHYVIPLDPLFRCVALFLLVVPPALAFFHGVCRPLFRSLKPAQVARRIEDRLPGIHNRLVSAIDLEAKPAGTISRLFLARLITEALERIRGFRASSLLDLVSLRNALVAAALALSASGAAWWLFHDRLPTTLARLFFPLADIPPASGVAYAVEPGRKNVLRDESIRFRATVTRGEAEKLSLVVYGHAGVEPRTYTLEPDRQDGSTFTADIDVGSMGATYKDGFTYRVFGGRTWSPLYRIGFVDRPVVVEVKVATGLPAYARNPALAPVADQAIVTGFEHGKVSVRVVGTGDVATGEVQLLAPVVRPLSAEAQIKGEEAWFADHIPTGASSGGRWEWSAMRRRPVHTEPATIGTYGHWFQGDPKGLAVRPGDVMFAYVRLPEDSVPAMVALEWHDGDGWEHRAYWGADRLKDGKPGTASRFRAGDLPKRGEWVRLTVPAAKVGLEGKLVRGIAFKMHHGQAYWSQCGRAPGLVEGLEVVDRYPLAGKGDNVWEGEFPLATTPRTKEGRFRVELRSTDGYPNKEVKERQFNSRPDLPPAVGVDRKSVETVISKPGAVPLGVDANDDVGLDEVRVITRPLVGGDAAIRVLWSAGAKVPPNDLRLTATLIEAAALKTGEGVRFVVEVQDTKKQVTRSDEYVVRVAADPNSADKLLADFDKQQDTFSEKLAKLLAEQKKINERMAELDREYATLDRKVQDLKDKGLKPDGKPLDDKTPVEKGKEAKGLTPEELKKLKDLQAEIAKLAGEEAKAAATANALDAELKGAIDKAIKSDLLPQEIADALTRTSDLFNRTVAKSLADLGKKLKDGSDAKNAPELSGTKQDGDTAEANIASLKDRLDAINSARKDLLKGDVARAIKALRDKMDASDVKDIAKKFEKELADLKDLIDKLREGLKGAREANDEADDDRRKGPDSPKAKAKREDVEKELKGLLAKAKRLLEKGKADDPEFPDDPGSGDDKDEKKVPPREVDTDEPLPMKKDKGKDKDEKKDGGKDGDTPRKDDKDDDEKLFQPRLGGPREKLDPRYAKKQRPVDRKGDKDEKDDDAADRAMDDSRKSDAAEKALKSDSNTLKDILDSLKDGQKGKKGKSGDDKDGEPKDGDPEARALADALRKMLEGNRMKNAMQMAKDGMGQKGRKPQQPGEPRKSEEGNLEGGIPGKSAKGELGTLDPATKAMLMRLPPRLREDMLRGQARKGPEAYEAFIQDYFKRLSEKK